MKKSTAVFLLFPLILLSCEKDDSLSNDLIGQWEWLSSTGGIAGVTLTPESTGNSVMIEFTASGKYREYTNGALTITCRYLIVRQFSIYSGSSVKLIVYDNSMIRQSYSVDGDTLILSDEVYDGFISRYEKIQEE